MIQWCPIFEQGSELVKCTGWGNQIADYFSTNLNALSSCLYPILSIS